jgi:glycosyltransferase domain-containing protein
LSLSPLRSVRTLQKITVVVLTFERSTWLKAVLNFWENKGVRVVVVDGSAEYAAGIVSGREEWLTYVHAPVSVIERMAIAAELVTTEYVIRSPDDEFFCPSFLDKAVRFLDENLDYVSCQGITVSFTLGGSSPSWGLHYPELLESLGDHKSSSDRYLSEVKNYAVRNYYSVSRVTQWKQVSSFCQELDLDVANLSEYVVELSMSFWGKSKLIPMVGWYRNLSEQPIRRRFLNLDSRHHFTTWWLMPSMAAQRRDLVEKMCSTLADRSLQLNKIAIRPSKLLIRRGLWILALNRLIHLPLLGKIRVLTWFLEPLWRQLSPLLRERAVAEQLGFLGQWGRKKSSHITKDNLSLVEVLPEYASLSQTTYREVLDILDTLEI